MGVPLGTWLPILVVVIALLWLLSKWADPLFFLSGR